MSSEDAVCEVVIALELKHHIDDVLQNLRTCNRAILGDMADDKYRYAELLRYAKKLRCAAAYLRGAARCRLGQLGKEGLD